jgi:Cobalamin synthesis protein cobW C-terminal domain
MKGIVQLTDEPRRFVFHGVHMTFDGAPGPVWRSGEPRQSEIVIIGRNLDPDALREGLDSCRVQNDAAAISVSSVTIEAQQSGSSGEPDRCFSANRNPNPTS